jgi:hypothetical protein
VSCDNGHTVIYERRDRRDGSLVERREINMRVESSKPDNGIITSEPIFSDCAAPSAATGDSAVTEVSLFSKR